MRGRRRSVRRKWERTRCKRCCRVNEYFLGVLGVCQGINSDPERKETKQGWCPNKSDGGGTLMRGRRRSVRRKWERKFVPKMMSSPCFVSFRSGSPLIPVECDEHFTNQYFPTM